MQTLTIVSDQNWQVVDITEDVANCITGDEGVVMVFIAHTTAAITTADLDPGTDLDLLDALKGMLPEIKWRHPHDPSHTPSHLLASIIGPSVNVPYKNGKLLLGAWQRIVLIELDGPKDRTVIARC